MIGVDLTGIIVSIGVVVVLPVAIVWIVFRAAINKDNKRTAIVMKAIESGNGNLDVGRLAESLRDVRKSPRQLLNLRLLRGCIFTLVGVALTLLAYVLDPVSYDGVEILGLVALAIGISYLLVYAVTRKQVAAEEAVQGQASTSNFPVAAEEAE